ncbi:hypothetical protein GCM10022408_05940 [Hymenobacter fastidiosus]|uniref:Uncharacterized protein n=1 Tax=Hymenobacter fastidiosus TaxID=486264 RepID=A0ABP7RIL5_9BACT
MAKDKKKNSKKDKPSNDLMDNAAKSLRKFRKVTKHITKLSTAQKVVGGMALLAAGLTYLAKKQADADGAATLKPDADAAEVDLATLAGEGEGNADYATDWVGAESGGGMAESRKSKRHR